MYQKKFLIIGIIAALFFGALIVIAQKNPAKSAQEQNVYYCPMHPTYISDRPGDCPICNMKLVKKEASAKPSAKQSQKRDICYLHHCPHCPDGHDGKSCPMLVVGKEGENINCPFCKSHVASESKEKLGEKTILYWTDPMIPGYKSDSSGKSPMGIDLVPVYKEQASSAASTPSPEGYAPVLITPQKQQVIGIKTASLKREKMFKTIRAVGTIAHDPELYQAQSEYIQALKALEGSKQSAVPEIVEQAQSLVESSQIRLKHMGLNEEIISEIAASKEAELSLLYSTPGEPVWVYARIYEYELPLIKIGQKVITEIPSLPGKAFEGAVRAIDLMVDPATRTTRIRAQINDPSGELKPDMYVNVTIDVDLGEILAIPQEAVFDTGSKKIVFVDKGQGLFEPRDVTLGAQAQGYYELKGGIQEGEMVVVSGNFLIDSESRLKSALEGMPSSSDGGHIHGQ